MPTEPEKAVDTTPKDNNKKVPPKGKGKKVVDELSEEDQKLKEELELLVERARDTDAGIQKQALDALKVHIRESTSSMTSVPKPLKFLRTHYASLKEYYSKLPDSSNKLTIADILSVLAMSIENDARDSLAFRLVGANEDVGSWGHEYVRHLSGELGHEFEKRQAAGEPVDKLNALVGDIIPFVMAHNAEQEAVDLLLEVKQLELIEKYVDENNYTRVCLYLLGFGDYLEGEEMEKIMRLCERIYRKMKQYPLALRIGIKLADLELIKDIYESCDDVLTKKQLAFMLARQRMHTVVEDSEQESILNHTNLNEAFLALGRDLDIVEAKTPDDIYKTHLSDTKPSATVDSARHNLASTFVNAFVNAGFGQDKLMSEDGKTWLYKNKEHGMMSAAASLGMVLLWDVEGGLVKIDKFLYSNDDYIKAGSLLAVGIVNSGVRNDCDPALALLAEYVSSSSVNLRIGSILGLGLAYAGSNRDDIAEMLTPVFDEPAAPMEVLGVTALALGLIYIGTGNANSAQLMIETLLTKDETALGHSHARYIALGLGFLFLAKQSASDLTVEALKPIAGSFGLYAQYTVETCAYAGTGNVLKVQRMLHVASDHLEDKNGHQAVAVLGISLIAMGEDLGTEMALRTFDHMLQYGEPVIRRAVPIALGLISVSNARISVVETLGKLSHDHDHEVAQSAILGLGLVGAGSNNAKIAGMLRALASYYYKEANHLFVVRLAQGLLHLGKGTITLSPFHSDRFLMSPMAVAGLLTVLHSALDLKNLILGKHHYMLYTLVSSMFPRMLMTYDEDLKPLTVSVRVGQAVDVVGQAGKPKTITGFQTHTTPVLLGHQDRAELATDEYLPVTSVLEGFVILKKNPNATAQPEPLKKK